MWKYFQEDKTGSGASACGVRLTPLCICKKSKNVHTCMLAYAKWNFERKHKKLVAVVPHGGGCVGRGTAVQMEDGNKRLSPVCIL